MSLLEEAGVFLGFGACTMTGTPGMVSLGRGWFALREGAGLPDKRFATSREGTM